jgi:hypothetical protein
VSERTPGDFDCQIAELLAGTTLDLTIWKQLTAISHADIFCGLFLKNSNEGISISPQTLSMLGESGITLDLDIYAPDEQVDE